MTETKSDFIATDLISKIYQNYYQSQLPPQRQLALHYDVSRFTIQKALQKLHNIGIIHPIQGAGLYINKEFKDNSLIYNSMLETSYCNIESKPLYLKKIKVTTELKKIFGLESNDYVWQFQRLRYLNYVLSQIETSYLPTTLFSSLKEADVADSVQGYVMKRGYKISHFITQYEASQITKEEAQLLRQKKGFPAMHIQSRGILSDGRIFCYSTITAIHYSCSYINAFDASTYQARRK